MLLGQEIALFGRAERCSLLQELNLLYLVLSVRQGLGEHSGSQSSGLRI